MKFFLEEKHRLDEKFVLLEEPETDASRLYRGQALADALADLPEKLTAAKEAADKALERSKAYSKDKVSAIKEAADLLDELNQADNDFQIWQNKGEFTSKVSSWVKKAQEMLRVSGEVPSNLAAADRGLDEVREAVRGAAKDIAWVDPQGAEQAPTAQQTDAQKEVSEIIGTLKKSLADAKMLLRQQEGEIKKLYADENIEAVQKNVSEASAALGRSNEGDDSEGNAASNALDGLSDAASYAFRGDEAEAQAAEAASLAENAEKTKEAAESLADRLNRWEPSKDTDGKEDDELAEESKNLLKSAQNVAKEAESLKNRAKEAQRHEADVEQDSKALRTASRRTGGMPDWKSEFANAEEYDLKNPLKASESSKVDAVWDRYFDTEWKGYDRSALTRLMPALTKEINAYGYTEASNPFVAYLKKVLKSSAFAKAIYDNFGNYSVLHNAVIDDLLDERDLRGTGEFKEANLIFDRQLFALPGATFKAFLEKQAVVAKLFPNFSVNGGNGSLLKEKYPNIEDFAADLFYKGGNPASSDRKRTAGSSKNGLKDVSEVNKLISICFGNAAVSKAQSNLDGNASGSKRRLTESNFKAVAKEVAKNIRAKSQGDPKKEFQRFMAVLANLANVTDKNDLRYYENEFGFPFGLASQPTQKDLSRYLGYLGEYRSDELLKNGLGGGEPTFHRFLQAVADVGIEAKLYERPSRGS